MPECPVDHVGREVEREGVGILGPAAVVGGDHRHPAGPVRQPNHRGVRCVLLDDGVRVKLSRRTRIGRFQRPGRLENMIVATICQFGAHHQVLLHVHDGQEPIEEQSLPGHCW